MISVVIPNYNGKKFLKTCLDSLRKQTYKDFEVILVDNGSTDGSVDFVKQNYPEVKILSLPANKGFAYAVNAGIRQSQGECIALLNNDTEADPHWLEALQAALEGNPQIDFCASKILFSNKPKIINSAGDLYRPSGEADNRGKGQLDRREFNRLVRIFGACGAAALYRRKLFEDIGLFDEDFFAYYEDVDLSFRAQLRGYQCLYVPTAVVYHVGGGTVGRKSAFREFHCEKNLIYTLVKNMPWQLLIKYAPRILAYQLRSSGRIFKHGIGLGIAALKGKIVALKLLPRTLKKRKKIQRERRVSVRYIDSILTKRSLRQWSLDLPARLNARNKSRGGKGGGQ